MLTVAHACSDTSSARERVGGLRLCEGEYFSKNVNEGRGEDDHEVECVLGVCGGVNCLNTM